MGSLFEEGATSTFIVIASRLTLVIGCRISITWIKVAKKRVFVLLIR